MVSNHDSVFIRNSNYNITTLPITLWTVKNFPDGWLAFSGYIPHNAQKLLAADQLVLLVHGGSVSDEPSYNHALPPDMSRIYAN